MRKANSLSSDQEDALKEFLFWLDEKTNDIPFLLTGYAGSGKTFLSRKFLELVEEKNICWTVAAPTHKAVGILRKAIFQEGLKPTWYPSTIHRLLRLKLKRLRDVEVCEQTNQTAKSLDQLGLLLIDEASMLQSDLLEIIIKCAHEFKTRLVFIGDPAQLPPVGENKSPVFSLNKVVKAHLNEVIRHQGPVLKLANLIRKNSFPCSQPPYFSVFGADKTEIGSLDQKSWLEKAKSSLRIAAEKNNPDAVRILCYTNRYLERLVPHARRAVYGPLADEMEVLPGEVLISRRAVMSSATIEGDESGEGHEPGIIFGSNTELIVRDVYTESFNLGDLNFGDLNTSSYADIQILIAKVSIGKVETSIRILPDFGSRSRIILDELMEQLCDKARRGNKKESRSLWRQFFYLRDSFASVGPASVLTVHRSQGSTFTDVFIAGDVFKARDYLLRKQLTYVAISRASRSVWIEGTNDFPKSNNAWKENFMSV